MGPGAADILDGLNESQKEAVMTIDGPLLVVAGPGTGKTLTMVRRIAYLVHQGVRPENILAVTFTNRAAREMKERTGALLGTRAGNIFIGTFHLLGLRIIREARGSDLVIYSRDEQIELLKSLMKSSSKQARQAGERISRIKNFLVTDNPPGEQAEVRGCDDIQALYAAYQSALRERNAFDFDDLVLTPIDILQHDPSNSFRNRFTHIIVDEYQDINPAQYWFMKLLVKGTNDICVVGDPDQAIYAFRGADIGNFLRFETDFPGAKRVILSENYRSTGTILSAAGSLIANNRARIDKDVLATREQGCGIPVLSVPDERSEGDAIVEEIEARIGGTSHDQMRKSGRARDFSRRSCQFSDFAVIFRTNAQAKALEEAFSASGIPYQVIGRKTGAQAKEIEETVAYLRSFLHGDGDGSPAASDDLETKLVAPADLFDPRADAVALMTMHMAKGLEFPIVFIAGCEDGLVPCTIMKDGADIEEERRLFYVGMTRAKDELVLLSSRKRFLYGQRYTQEPSPFLRGIPERLIEQRAVPERIRKQKEPDPQMGLF